MPGRAAAAEPAPLDNQTSSAVVAFVQDGTETRYPTRAHTVAQFLGERSVVVGDQDFISARLQDPVVDGMHLEYRAAIAVSLLIDGRRESVVTSADSVRSMLASLGVVLGEYDEVLPSLDARPSALEPVRVVRVNAWIAKAHKIIAPRIVHRPDANLPRGSKKVIARGEAGLREIVERVVAREGQRVRRTAIATSVLRKPKDRIVAYGTQAPPDFVELARERLGDAVGLAGRAVRMIATAYIAGCYGCSGITAMGMPAGHGIVAVDPRFIPLGTKLFVPGYGRAVAGDTGGAIKGRRIDLGFNDLGSALRFGRREVTVYVLR